jgi:hypothetical protein
MVRFYEVEVRYRQIQSALNAVRALNGIRDAVCTTDNGSFFFGVVDERMLIILLRSSFSK